MRRPHVIASLFAGLVVALVAVSPSAPARALEVPGPLVETDWLAAHLGEVNVLDVRVNPKGFTAKPIVRKDKKTGKIIAVARPAGHIPGALLVPYKQMRAKKVIAGNRLKGMLPDKATFEALLQKAGVKAGRPIVIVTLGTGPGDMTVATRAYWQLKYYGEDNVAILNGGLSQWILEGRPISTDAPQAAKGDWTAKAERKELLATSEDVAKAVADKSAQLVDNRSLAEYLGVWHKSYVYAPGHIPGAKPFPNELMVTRGGASKFLPAPRLRKLLEEMGIKPDAPTIAYCNSGHLASGGWFIQHELLGNKAVKLYDGSMHQWTLEKRPTTALKLE